MKQRETSRATTTETPPSVVDRADPELPLHHHHLGCCLPTMSSGGGIT